MKKKITAMVWLLTIWAAASCTMMTYAAQTMTISQNGLKLIESLEGYHSTAYKAVSTEKYYTIGYGHYGKDVYEGMTITREQGEELLRKDLEKSVASVNQFLAGSGISVSQNQFDALVSFTFNCGIYVWTNTKDFTLRTMLQNGISQYSDAQIREAFTSWNKAGGKINDGLINRRNQEATLFLQGRVTPRPTPRFTPAPSSYRVSYRRVLYVNESALASSRMSGTDVKYLQVCLYYLGYDVAYDGIFGSGTADAVRAFQTHYDLDVDGKCDRATWNAMENAVAANPAVASVTVRKKPSKLIYTAGESFNASGMMLKVSYIDGTAEEIAGGFTCTPSGQLNTVGQQKIVVSYGGKSTGFYVTVGKAVASVAIRKKPDKQVHTAGESFNASGMMLKVTYTDGTTEDITNGFICTPSGQLNTVGQQKIVVSYGGKSTGFYVTVGKAAASVAVKKKPDKQVYTAGESFNASGMMLKVTYTDGTVEEVTNGFTCTPSGKLNMAGQQKIVVSYGGKSTGFYVTVNQAAASVAVKKKPDKQVYTVGESFSTSGMMLKVTYTDGTVEEVTSGFTCTPQKMDAAGQQKIVVSYGGKSTGFYVTVNKVVASVVIAKKPAKLNYVVGEFFDASGMILRATYIDGTTGEIIGGYTFTPSGQLNQPGEQKIVVTYGGKATGFYVTVEE